MPGADKNLPQPPVIFRYHRGQALIGTIVMKRPVQLNSGQPDALNKEQRAIWRAMDSNARRSFDPAIAGGIGGSWKKRPRWLISASCAPPEAVEGHNAGGSAKASHEFIDTGESAHYQVVIDLLGLRSLGNTDKQTMQLMLSCWDEAGKITHLQAADGNKVTFTQSNPNFHTHQDAEDATEGDELTLSGLVEKVMPHWVEDR